MWLEGRFYRLNIFLIIFKTKRYNEIIFKTKIERMFQMELLTKQVEEKLRKFPYGSQRKRGLEAEVLVKFFNPCGAGTWLITEAEKVEDDWILYGYCSLGFGYEFGPVSLNELQAIKLPLGFTIERDLYLPEGKLVCDLISEDDLM